jgi:endonuclease G
VAQDTKLTDRRPKRALLASTLALIAAVASIWCSARPGGFANDVRGSRQSTTPGRHPARNATPDEAADRRALTPEDLIGSPHVALGVPTDSDSSDDVLLDRGAYVASYNPKHRGPNWVAWRLEHADIGPARRRNDFRIDPGLPRSVFHVEPRDYTHSGYERGHMCPSGDRTRDVDQNSITFLMTNMLPQVHELNDGPWKKLEEYERELTGNGGEVVYVVAGGLFTDTQPKIGRGVSVPVATYKIIVALRAGQTATQLTAETDLIGVIMPNDASVGAHVWSDYLTSVDAIEKATGYDFLSRVAEPIQRVIEARVSEHREARRRRSHPVEGSP